MTIATLADLKAGLQRPITFTKNSIVNAANVPAGNHTLWANIGWSTIGQMSSGSFNATLNGVVLTNPTAGQLLLPDPGVLEAYIARMTLYNCQHTGGIVVLADRIWQNGGFTITATTPQLITSPAWPARDDNGSSNGDGVFLGLELSTGPTSGTPVVTVEYTNSAGVAGRTATTTIPTAARSPFGAWLFGLMLSTSWSTGTMHLFAYRPLAFISMCAMTLSQAQIFDAVSLCMPRIKPDTVPFFFSFTANSSAGHAGALAGDIIMSHG